MGMTTNSSPTHAAFAMTPSIISGYDMCSCQAINPIHLDSPVRLKGMCPAHALARLLHGHIVSDSVDPYRTITLNLLALCAPSCPIVNPYCVTTTSLMVLCAPLYPII